MHALIIEDDGLIAFYLEALLGDLGNTSFAWAATEEDALRAARDRCPDLITADLHLHTGDGHAAVRRIAERCRAALAIYVTANPDAVEDVPTGVAKPFDGEHLQQAIEAARTARLGGRQGHGR